MKKFMHFFMLFFVLSFVFNGCVIETHAIDGDIVQYEIYDESGNMLTFSSEVEIGDTILTKDFSEYQVYEINGQRCSARFLRKLNKPEPNNARKGQSSVGKKLCLYMTHNDESYTLSDGYDSIYGAGGIHDVAKSLKSAFLKKGIAVTLDETLHIPHDSKAYSRSSVTAKSLYSSQNPDALFDIHRDGVSRKYYLASYNGQEYSKVRIVVGKSNPNFEENYKFAQEVFAMGNELYPWLFLDIYCGKGHYNQELMSTNLLFEMGTYLIEKELVLKSVPCLADVVEKTMYSNLSSSEGEKLQGNLVPDSVESEQQGQLPQTSNNNSVTGLVVVGILLSGLIGFALVTNLRKKFK